MLLSTVVVSQINAPGQVQLRLSLWNKPGRVKGIKTDVNAHEVPVALYSKEGVSYM